MRHLGAFAPFHMIIIRQPDLDDKCNRSLVFPLSGVRRVNGGDPGLAPESQKVTSTMCLKMCSGFLLEPSRTPAFAYERSSGTVERSEDGEIRAYWRDQSNRYCPRLYTRASEPAVLTT